ncbi:Tim44/TimA family putative adaptor protein [Paralimibaculum aggregatum]|uniref:Tim44/TimA family putative adaptor protein n=1 Tax=Paralimibaculum aggregatum TaxID=3036245 RepID=A0ABQ6LJK4_9RHOB|nr:Tim44/TimA family putative adaptor protein [Limibaculum sp. NKW23]GMG83445.1 Tim44/TimA family putative adaptor protein [Limibaculum sp. NKW23]
MSYQLLEFIVLFAIAAFLLFKLRSVIGTRTGFEPPSSPAGRGADRAGPEAARPVEEDDEIEAAAMRALDEDARAAMAEIRKVEPGFSLEEFLHGARSAYEMILTAYEEGDRATLQDLLTPDVYAAFEGVIASRERDGLKVDSRFIGVRDLKVDTLRFDADTAEADLTLRFVGEMITAVRDSEGRIVEGDPNEIRRQTDVWTFSRVMGSPNPNWLLSATGE